MEKAGNVGEKGMRTSVKNEEAVCREKWIMGEKRMEHKQPYHTYYPKINFRS